MKDEAPDPEQLDRERLSKLLGLAPEQFSELLETLRKIVEEATGEAEIVDMEVLPWWTVAAAVQGYRADAWVGEEVKRMDVHKIAGPLRNTVLPILRNDANSGVLIDALGDGDFFKGVDLLPAVIGALERLAAGGAQHAPSKRVRARPARIDLRLLVGHLAVGWERLTKTRFSSRWHRGEPISLGTRFVHAVVKTVDPESSHALPTATRWVVHALKNGKVPGYFNDASRRSAR